jgi:cystathionine beta-lyase/cystathionine gamma-synthase
MKILIMSRNQAICYSYHKNIDDCIIISINDDKPARFDRTNDKIKHARSLFFNDIEYQTETGILMSDDDAQKIKVSVDAYKDKVDTVLVHCFAGVSRSSAIACAISMYLNGDDINIWSQGCYAPNIHCYKTTLKAFGITVTDEEIKRKQDINWKAFEESENAEVINKMFERVDD